MPKMEITLKPTPRQHQAWKKLTDKITRELLYGGGAGGGKTYLGCAWLLIVCQIFPGTRWLLGRKELKRLKQSALVTLFGLMSKWHFTKDVDYRYNSTMGSIVFKNGRDPQGNLTFDGGSEIILMDLAPMPSDPNYERLGSLEFTGGFIEESAEVEQKAKEVVLSRLRYRLSDFCSACQAEGLNTGTPTKLQEIQGITQAIEWRCPNCGEKNVGLIPKLLLTCNPHKGFLYMEFYKPWKANQLPADKAFIRALVTDNPYISPHYIESLKKLKDKVLRHRLLLGDWEYADDDLALFNYDALVDMFTNTVYGDQDGEKDQHGNIISEPVDKFIISDIARFGRDKATISVWEGLRMTELYLYDKSAMPTLETEILVLAQRHKIPMSRVLVDEDGIGGGVVDHLKCKGFVGNSTPIDERSDKELREVEYKINYQNLRTQCYYELAEKVNDRVIAITTESTQIKNDLVEELEQMKAIDVDKDAKFRIISKDDIKAQIGRSPDLADTLMMRMYFEVKPEKKKSRITNNNPFA